MKKFPGLGDRIRLRLRELGYWKRGRADVLRFCHEQRYRPQYVYAWLKDRVPTYENLQRLAADLGTSMPWLMFGYEDGTVARRQVVEMAAGETAPAPTPKRDRGHRRVRLRPAGETGPPSPAREPSPVQIIDFRRLREVSERLVQIEADLEAVVQAFPDGYLWLDREGTILSYRAGRGFDFGLPQDRLVSRRIEEVFPGEVATRLGAALAEALRARSVISMEYALGQEGRERTYEARFVSMGDRPASEDKVLVVLRDITERKQAAESTRALVQVGRELAGTLDAAQAADRVVATVLRLFRGRRAALWQVDPESGLLLCVAAAGEGNPGEWIGRTQPLQGSLTGQVVTAGRPRWTSDVLADRDITLPEESIRRVQREGIRSGIVVPLTAAGRTTGALFVGDQAGRVFAEEEVELLWGFGDLAAVAVENARLYLEAERGRRAAEVLAGLARDINASLDLDAVMQRVTGGARELCGADAAWIALREAGSEAVAFRYGAGDPVLHADVRVEPGKGLGGLMLLTGGPLRTSDWAADPRLTKEYLPKVRAEGVVAEIVVPIRIGDRIEGILYAANRAPRPFTDRDEAILAQLADHAAIAMQNARLYAAAETRRRAAESLAEGRAVSQSLDHEEVGRRIVRSVCTLLRSQYCVLYRLAPAGDTRAAVAIWGDDPFPERWTVVPAEAGISGLALRERRPVVSGDLLADPRLILTPELRSFCEGTPTRRAGLAVPLVFQDRVIGTISVADRQGRVFSEEEIGLVEAFAEEAVLALENARLHEAALGRVRALAALVEVNRAVTGTLDLHALAGAILEAARTLLPGCAGKFWEMLPDGETLRIVEHRGFATAPDISVTGVGPGQGLTGIAAQTRAIVTSPDVRQDQRVRYPERMVAEGLVSAIVLPLLHAGTLYGTLNLFTRAPHVFTADEVGLLESFAAQAAVAIMNARLYAHAERRRRAAEGLAELGRLLLESLEPRELARRIADSVLALFGVRASALYRLDEASGDLVSLAHAGDHGPVQVPNIVLPRGAAVSGLAVRERRAAQSPDILADPRLVIPAELRARVEQASFRSTLAVPLLVQGRPIGALSLGDRPGRVFDEEEIRLVQAFADQAALALDTARRFEESQRRLAELEGR